MITYLSAKRTLLLTLIGVFIFSTLNWTAVNAASSKKPAEDSFQKNLTQATSLLKEAVKYNNTVYSKNPSYDVFSELSNKWDKGKSFLIATLKSNKSTDTAYLSQLQNLGYKVTTTLHSDNSGVQFVRRYESVISVFNETLPYHTILQIKYNDGRVELVDNSSESLNVYTVNDSDIGFYQNNKKEVLMLVTYMNYRGGAWNLRLLNMSKSQRLEAITSIIPVKSLPKGFERYGDSKKTGFSNICGEGSCSDAEESQFSLVKQDESAGVVTFGTKAIKLQNVIVSKTAKSNKQKLIEQMNHIAANGTVSGLKVGLTTPYEDVVKLYGKPLEEGGTSFFKNFAVATDGKEKGEKVTWLSFNSKAIGLQGVTMAQLQQWYGVKADKDVSRKNSYSLTIQLKYEGSTLYDTHRFNVEFWSEGANKPITSMLLSVLD
ncbi:hypothetical protein [Cohnella abietis]|uniref:Uncharacterized protein n=1 Tax=Cohnella abietis TaxID=2507935 RepID=A0A3T1CZ46_9BACL|nr:hypothetical protein [Cohnella abietis]BBI31025.1 hypothetical protein KCTCHS21_04240 [Cohnella abietis]